VSHFSIMLVPDSGQTKTYRLSRARLRMLSSSAILLILFGFIGAYSVYSSYELRKELQHSQSTVQKERQHFAQQKTVLQAELKAEEEKMGVYARSLGQMQARLSRLDSLGKRLVQDSSSLTKSEFNFDVKPAFGGPRVASESNKVDIELFDHVQLVDAQISTLNTQLVAVDYLLQNDVDENNARPHAWPSEGGWLSSNFGIRIDPFTAKKARHNGIDIANRLGSPVLSGSRGVVVYSGKMRDYGYLVEIEHGYGYRTRYGHMSASTVVVGDIVDANQMIGRVGSSGRSTGPHLHYEVRRNNQALNPKSFIPKG
jgi:murein DD-endopeptidase MepM/ murein hydrolase activator NlpD